MHRSSILAILASAALAAACSDDAQPTALAGLPDQSAGAPTDTGTTWAAFPGAVWGYGAAGADSADGLGRVPGATVRALTGSPEREVASVTSAADGTFKFETLADGTYRFVATPPAGSEHGSGELRDVVVADGRMKMVQYLNIILERP